jgi:hypothetical protein
MIVAAKIQLPAALALGAAGGSKVFFNPLLPCQRSVTQVLMSDTFNIT